MDPTVHLHPTYLVKDDAVRIRDLLHCLVDDALALVLVEVRGYKSGIYHSDHAIKTHPAWGQCMGGCMG